MNKNPECKFRSREGDVLHFLVGSYSDSKEYYVDICFANGIKFNHEDKLKIRCNCSHFTYRLADKAKEYNALFYSPEDISIVKIPSRTALAGMMCKHLQLAYKAIPQTLEHLHKLETEGEPVNGSETDSTHA